MGEFFKIKEGASKCNILLVEDNVLCQKVVQLVIAEFGFDADVAANGLVAIEKMSTTYYDVILMDLQMPKMDGFEASIYIHNVLNLKTPIIAMTANLSIDEKEKCMKVGMNDHICKPFSNNELYFKICKQTSRHSLNVNHPPTKNYFLKGINLSLLTELSEGNNQFELEMIALFIEIAPKDILQMYDGVKENNISVIKKLAHNLKSTVSLFSLPINDLIMEISKFEGSQSKKLLPHINSLNEIITQSIKGLNEIIKSKNLIPT